LRIVGIDLDDPAEAIGLVRLLVEVEAVEILAPGIGDDATEPIALGQHLVGMLGAIAREVEVEILLAGQPRPPRRLAAGAVVEHAQHLGAGGIGRRLHPGVARRRAGDAHRRVGIDAASVAAAVDDLPAATLSSDLDHRAAVCGHLDRGLRLVGAQARLAALADAGQHQVGVRVLVVDHHQEAVARRVAGRQRMQAEEVVVVAELQRLRGAAQFGRIIRCGAGQHRIAPADQDLHLVVVRHVVRRIVDVRHLLEGEGGRSALLRLRRAAAECHRGGSKQHGASRQAPLDQLANRDFGGGRDALVFVNHGSSFHPLAR
jgi:hypothetical protein